MACLPSYLVSKYTADLERVQAQIKKANESLEAALENSEVEEYSFNSGEGTQRTKRRSIKELQSVLNDLESREAWLLRKLNGTSLVNLNLRRKG